MSSRKCCHSTPPPPTCHLFFADPVSGGVIDSTIWDTTHAIGSWTQSGGSIQTSSQYAVLEAVHRPTQFPYALHVKVPYTSGTAYRVWLEDPGPTPSSSTTGYLEFIPGTDAGSGKKTWLCNAVLSSGSISFPIAAGSAYRFTPTTLVDLDPLPLYIFVYATYVSVYHPSTTDGNAYDQANAIIPFALAAPGYLALGTGATTANCEFQPLPTGVFSVGNVIWCTQIASGSDGLYDCIVIDDAQCDNVFKGAMPIDINITFAGVGGDSTPGTFNDVTFSLGFQTTGTPSLDPGIRACIYNRYSFGQPYELDAYTTHEDDGHYRLHLKITDTAALLVAEYISDLGTTLIDACTSLSGLMIPVTTLGSGTIGSFDFSTSTVTVDAVCAGT